MALLRQPAACEISPNELYGYNFLWFTNTKEFIMRKSAPQNTPSGFKNETIKHFEH